MIYLITFPDRYGSAGCSHKAPGCHWITFQLWSSATGRQVTRDSTRLVNIIQTPYMVAPKDLVYMILYIGVYYVRLSGRSQSLYCCLGIPGFIWTSLMSWDSMDPLQWALPLQLHSNSFGMSSGEVPKISSGGGGGSGGGGQSKTYQFMSVSGWPQVNSFNAHWCAIPRASWTSRAGVYSPYVTQE